MVPDTDTYICVGRDSGPDIEIIIVTPKLDLPDLLREKKYPGWLDEGTMWHVTIAFKPEHIRQHRFAGHIDGLGSYS